MNQSTAVSSHVLTTAEVATLIDVAENLPARVERLEAAIDGHNAHAEPCTCGWAETRPEAHDRLLRIEDDLSVVAHLVDVAITWTEVDYGTEEIEPEDLPAFVGSHNWRNPVAVYEIARMLWADVTRPRMEELHKWNAAQNTMRAAS